MIIVTQLTGVYQVTSSTDENRDTLIRTIIRIPLHIRDHGCEAGG